MKLKTYAKIIQEAANKYPNLDVYYASDDEGNSFNRLDVKECVRVRIEDGDVLFCEGECLENPEEYSEKDLNGIVIN